MSLSSTLQKTSFSFSISAAATQFVSAADDDDAVWEGLLLLRPETGSGCCFEPKNKVTVELTDRSSE